MATFQKFPYVRSKVQSDLFPVTQYHEINEDYISEESEENGTEELDNGFKKQDICSEVIVKVIAAHRALLSILCQIGSVLLWPRKLRDLFFKRNVCKDFERFLLVMFVGLNGLNKDFIFDWMENRDQIRDPTIFDHYNRVYNDVISGKYANNRRYR